MDSSFDFSHFLTLFPNDDSCLEEIKKLKFPYGIFCDTCKIATKHYRLHNRPAYSCVYCRHQVYPLAETIFEKSSTPLRLWFFAIFLMLYTRGTLSRKQLQRELGVTYKTAWRIYNSLYELMEQNNGNLLKGTLDIKHGEYKERKWIFFNKLEIKVVQKQELFEDDEA